jgi:cholest-4-en-3-one 26-monooxygenase
VRWVTPARSRLRVARFDTEIGGKSIKAGDWVVPFLSSANRDEAEFEDPHAFNILRERNNHLSFGEGIHGCLGRHLEWSSDAVRWGVARGSRISR